MGLLSHSTYCLEYSNHGRNTLFIDGTVYNIHNILKEDQRDWEDRYDWFLIAKVGKYHDAENWESEMTHWLVAIQSLPQVTQWMPLIFYFASIPVI